MLRFEVTEEPSPGVDGERFCYVPGLGMWRGRPPAARPTRAGTDARLGSAWDDALEPFRLAGDGAPVTWLHQVG